MEQGNLIRKIQRHFLVIVVVLIGLIITSQFAILATLGTKGVEIGRIRAEKEQLRVENETIRSEIDEAKTLAQIEDGLYEVFDLVPSRTETMSAAPTNQTTAQNVK